MAVPVPCGGELVERLIAIAAAEWKWLPRCAQEGTLSPLFIIHRRTNVADEKTSQKED